MFVEPLDIPGTTQTFVFSFDDAYSKYFSVALASLIAHARADVHYDIVVLHDCVTEKSMQMLQDMLPDNFSLRFVDVSGSVRELFGSVESHTVAGKWNVATFYDLLVPLVMPGYERALYCDCDLVFADDPSELFETPFDGCELIAVRDSLAITKYMAAYNEFFRNQLLFLRDMAGVTDVSSYINGGVLCFNIPAIDTRDYLVKVREALAFPQLPTVDQDVLNYVFKGALKLVPQRFNVQVSAIGTIAPEEASSQAAIDFTDGLKSPAIVHYTTEKKPWKAEGCAMDDLFWEYAKHSPWHGELKADVRRQRIKIQLSRVKRAIKRRIPHQD